ncbi:GPP34 family phosphoprotein [Streptomyces sp. NBC_00289]|uniref:GPP34 family phosphoprotein n=1 Tax=Streptomyces sp. NBC_00289 TaxID=2975703 RepID=UPI0032507F13
MLLAAKSSGGWHGDQATEVLPSAGLLLDGALTGAFSVQRQGWFRRTVTVHPGDMNPALAPDQAVRDLARRVHEATLGTVWTWLERAAVFAPDLVCRELETAGVAHRCTPRDWRARLVNDFGMDIDDTQAHRHALQRVLDAVEGRGNQSDVALTLLLDAQNVLPHVVPAVSRRRARRQLLARVHELPTPAREVVDMMQSWRHRREMEGGD